MANIVELYRRKKNFPQYRKEQLRTIQDAPEAEKLRELKARKARMAAEIDAEIAKLRLRIATQGDVPLSKTARKKLRADELSEEKREIDNQFAAEVQQRFQAGHTVSQIAKECGADSLSLFYQAMNYSNPNTIDLNLAEGRFDPRKHTWEYADYSKVHRYGVNPERTHFRIHDTSDPNIMCYIRRADGAMVYGDEALQKAYNPERAETLVAILDGLEYDKTGLRERVNPYRNIMEEM